MCDLRMKRVGYLSSPVHSTLPAMYISFEVCTETLPGDCLCCFIDSFPLADSNCRPSRRGCYPEYNRYAYSHIIYAVGAMLFR